MTGPRAVERAGTGDPEQAGSQTALGEGTAGATAPRPGVSVVVCSFTEDRWDDLERAVASLHTQTEAPAEIILVVDYCPGLLARAGQEMPGVTVLANRFEQGLAGARNTGMAEASSDVVAFLDDDAVADSDWIARLAGSYTDATVVGVGGLVRPAWDDGRPSWFPAELDWVVGCSYTGLPSAAGPVRNFIGANMSFRRDVLVTMSGFSTDLGRIGTRPLGCEETELCLRVGQRYPDGVLLYQPAVGVSHRVGPRRARWRYLWSRCYAEGLSKARVAAMAGAQRALASERSYVRSDIPRAVGRSLVKAARGRPSGLLAAFALVSAVLLAGVGYLAGKAAGARQAAPGPAGRLLRWAGTPAALPWIGVVLSVTLWGAALKQTDVTGVERSALGLTPVLPVTYWAATGLLMVSFGATVVRRNIRWPAMAAHLAALVAILHATPAILYGTLRYSWAWKHIGIIDFITHHGIIFNLGGILGPYQGWPGFFALNSFLTTGGGQQSALSYASWALPVNDLLWLGPIILIARAFTSDQRLVWTAAWLFELANWVGQDYFSPQAFAFFLYLAVVAVCLRWLWIPGTPRPPRDPAGPPARRRVPWPVPGLAAAVRRLPRGPAAGLAGRSAGRAARIALLEADVPPADADSRRLPASARLVLAACLLPVMAAIASSHQLTPFMLVGALAILVVFRQLRPAMLPVVMAVITVGSILYEALPWLSANSSQVFDGFGLPWANTSAHLVGGTVAVPFGQVIVKWGARLLGLIVSIVAVTGFFRYRRHHDAPARRSWNRTALLAGAAVPAVAASSYGGEIIFRVFLFALPFMAVAAAAAFFPHPGMGRPGRAGLGLTIVSIALAGLFCVSNYGQEAIDYFTPGEVAASQWLYRTAPPGTRVVAENYNFPWAFVHYNWYTYATLDVTPSRSRDVFRHPVGTVTRFMLPDHSPPSYLILTTSETEQDVLTGTWPTGASARLTRELLASGKFRVVYRNANVLIMQLRPVPGAAPTGAVP